MRLTLVALAALGLASCSLLAPQPPAPPAEASAVPVLADIKEARAAAADDGATLYAIDAAASELRIFVFRGGLAPTRGKNHVLSAPTLDGFVALRSKRATNAGFMLGFDARELALDAPALRKAVGGSFTKPLSAEQIEGTRANMLGESVLDLEARRPDVVLRSVEIGGDWPILVARVEVALHGRTQIYDSLMEVRREAERLVAEGSLVIRQSDFGITPMSVFGGLIGLQDPVGIEYRIVAQRAT